VPIEVEIPVVIGTPVPIEVVSAANRVVEMFDSKASVVSRPETDEVATPIVVIASVWTPVPIVVEIVASVVAFDGADVVDAS